MLYCSQFLKGVAHGASNFEQRTMADSDKFIVIENNCYFPAEAVHFELLREHAGYHTECPWKGTASYCDVIMDGPARMRHGRISSPSRKHRTSQGTWHSGKGYASRPEQHCHDPDSSGL
jgi:hypothetical protein